MKKLIALLLVAFSAFGAEVFNIETDGLKIEAKDGDWAGFRAKITTDKYILKYREDDIRFIFPYSICYEIP